MTAHAPAALTRMRAQGANNPCVINEATMIANQLEQIQVLIQNTTNYPEGTWDWEAFARILRLGRRSMSFTRTGAIPVQPGPVRTGETREATWSLSVWTGRRHARRRSLNQQVDGSIPSRFTIQST